MIVFKTAQVSSVHVASSQETNGIADEGEKRERQGKGASVNYFYIYIFLQIGKALKP